MEYSQQALGNRIKEYRDLRQLSQKQLSEKSGVSKGYISKLELGLGNSISLPKIGAIAKALNVSIDDLLKDSLMVFKDIDLSSRDLSEKIISEYVTATPLAQSIYERFVLRFLDLKK